ncbi:MAG TPA: Fe-S cluster assembly protein SufB, partial [Deinococcales bacterium]|nr:Fe-S cluster assembly protein SufB [Deinococcales bacterium]
MSDPVIPAAEDVSSIGATYDYGFATPENYEFKAPRGLSREVVELISKAKNEPEWMLQFRLKALDVYLAKPMPTWGADLSGLNLDEIYYYIKPPQSQDKTRTWDDVSPEIKTTFDRLGIPEAERGALAGVGAQYESEMVYHNLKEAWEKQGVIFLSIEDGMREHPDIFRQYFATVIPPEDNKFAALNSAVWSGG